jgi:hypothetical protein
LWLTLAEAYDHGPFRPAVVSHWACAHRPRYSSQLPSYIGLDDLIGYGQVGLAQAARDFDHERGMQFSTFAYYRIRGAILDGANLMNWLRRKTRAGDAFERGSGDVLELESGDSAGHSPNDEAWLQGVSSHGRLPAEPGRRGRARICKRLRVAPRNCSTKSQANPPPGTENVARRRPPTRPSHAAPEGR